MNRTREQYEAFKKLVSASLYCFLIRDGVTLCNNWAIIRLAGLGLFLPNLKASQIRDWLASPVGGGAMVAGLWWFPVDELTAKQRVESFKPVIIVWKNPDPEAHGHIAIGEPAPERKELCCSAAGLRNQDCAPWRDTFGHDKDGQVEFFTTDQ